MAWTPPTTGGVPTCYNVSINDSSSPVVIPANEASLYTSSLEEGLKLLKSQRWCMSTTSIWGQLDQLIIYYGYSQRQVKWWRRVFFHLLDLSIANTSILYNITNAKPLTQMDFRIELAKGLLQGHTRRQGRHFTVSQKLPLRLTEHPFAEKVDTDTPHGGRPRCEVCRAKRSQTKYRCKVCKVPLHLEDCFETYHTKLNYGQL